MVQHTHNSKLAMLVKRFIPLVGGALIALSGVLTPAHAFQFHVTERARFVGQVATLLPAYGSPTSFVLLEPAFAVTVAINPQTQLTGQSAEANVEGLVRDDYAVVNARRVGGRWVANRITYDVDPILPLRSISGSIVKVSLDGRRVNLRLDSGGNRAITIGRLARYRLDGRIIDPPPILSKGENIGLVINRALAPWVALEVDVHSLP